MFARQIDDFWNSRFAAPRRADIAGVQTSISAELDADMRVMILEHMTGETRAVLTPEIAGLIGMTPRSAWVIEDLRRALADKGVVLHGADHLFYCPEDMIGQLGSRPAEPDVRRLTAADAAQFARFEAAATEQDLDDASVALDHWAAFGAFAGDRLVAIGSIYPWMNAPLADMGVLTLADARGQGHARAVVRAMAAYAMAQGLQPQYRCQTDNDASIALARSAGFAPYGIWTAETPAISVDRQPGITQAEYRSTIKL